MNDHVRGDVFVELEDEDAVVKQEESGFADAPDVNWEMMVEEEEKSILTGEEGSKATRSQTVGKDHGQLEDAGILEKKYSTEAEKEDEMVWEIEAAREENIEVEDGDVSEGKRKIGEELGEIMAGKDRKEVAKALQCQATHEALAEEIEEEETELEEENHLAEIHKVDIEKTNVQNEEDMEEEEEMEMDLSDDEETGVEWEDQVKPMEEDAEEENPDHEEECFVVGTVESEIRDSESEDTMTEEEGCFEVRSDVTQNNVQDERVIDRENERIPTEMHLYEEADDLTEVAGDESGSVAAEGGSPLLADEPESDQWSHDSASAESDSDDEVELYMHCLRAVHAGERAQTDRNKDSKARPPVGKGKLLPAPMPSISEAQDEEQHPGRLLDAHEDTETADVQPTAAASNGPESIDRNMVSWWKETFSCSNISKTLLYATLLVVFLVVAYRYDFLACVGLYLISVIWLYCQGERQPKQQENNRIG